MGITASLYGNRNERGALCQILDASVYVSFHGATATPDSGDFLLTAGYILFIQPASMARFIRVTTDARVKVQIIE